MRRLRQLFQYLTPYRREILASILCNVLVALFTVVSIPTLDPFLKALFYDQVTPLGSLAKPAFSLSGSGIKEWMQYHFSQAVAHRGREWTLLVVLSLFVSLFLFKNVFRYLAMFFMAPVRMGIVRDVRNRIFHKLVELPMSYFSNERKGDLMSRFGSDVTEIEWSILSGIEILFREPLILTGSLVFMFIVNPMLTLFIFGLILVAGLIIGSLTTRLRKQSKEAQNTLGSINSILEESLGGMRIIKGFSAESYMDGKLRQANEAFRDVLIRVVWRRDLSSPLSEFLGVLVASVLIYYGSVTQVFTGKIDPESFLTLLYAFFLIITSAKNFSNAWFNIQKGMAAVDRVEEILAVPNTICDAANPIRKRGFQDKIVFRNVSFRYPGTEIEVLRNIDLEIPKGKLIAIVGSSGSGKSTLVDLVPRFYDVNAGVVEIDGADIRQIAIQDLRQLIGIVTQEPILFNDTIFQNLVFNATDISREQVEHAARIANAHEFILQTESGYDTNIGDKGMKLSGGQRQRLTIARAVLKNPPILILDEATSSLDTESEKLVQQALDTVMQDRTSIVIAHRLSTILHADEIIVMKDGCIVERGNHESLLRQDGEYKKLYTLQAF